MLHLITGGARSGKSSHAEQLARAHAGPIHYLATAAVGDAEMAHRVVMHQARRPVHWRVIECGAGLPAALEDAARPDGLVLVDCLTLWLVHFLEQPAAFMAVRQTLLDTLAGVPGDVLLVSNEIGCGVVPLGESNRWFVDELGRLNQDVGALADKVTLLVAGQPLAIKAGRT